QRLRHRRHRPLRGGPPASPLLTRPPGKTCYRTCVRLEVSGTMSVAYQPSFDELGVPLSEVTFVVLDLETTGGSAAACEITEVGAARYRMGEELATFQTLVDPGAPIPPFITVLTGITQAMVLEAPPIEAVLPALFEFI